MVFLISAACETPPPLSLFLCLFLLLLLSRFFLISLFPTSASASSAPSAPTSTSSLTYTPSRCLTASCLVYRIHCMHLPCVYLYKL
ncbi:hypothetical protein LI328DRAFT_133842 [Trichoderma asperelloides]|nr:hypothetical protein LI328DRAFT_133842 [Trichoderma asperelloides]